MLDKKVSPRFSDEQLIDMRRDFEEHLADFGLHKTEQERRWEQLQAMVEKNTEATERLAESVEGVVQLYKDVRGAARVGMGLQKFLIWLAGLGTAGATVAAAVVYVLDKLGP